MSIGVTTVKETKESSLKYSYKYFLAVRPQNWEENAVTMVLESLCSPKPRIYFTNLSLSSSFLVARMYKKFHKEFKQSIFCDTSVAHLYFHDKMIKSGQT